MSARARRHDEQLGVPGVGVVSGPDHGPAGQVDGGVKEVHGLGLRLLPVHINIDKFVHQALGNEGIPGVGAHVSGSDDNNLSAIDLHVCFLL